MSIVKMNNNTDNDYNFYKIKNGLIAETTSTLITYPLNTIKTNIQTGNVVKNEGIKGLYRGIKWGLPADALAAICFYGIFDALPQFQSIHPLFRSILAASIATTAGHPFTTIRKNIQVHRKPPKKMNIGRLYKGLKVSLCNTTPGVSINFTTKEFLKPIFPCWAKPFIGIISSTCSLIVTHPLDTFTTCLVTGKQKDILKCLNLNGFKSRFSEKICTLSSKMIILDSLNENDQKNKNN
jgi:hypothetical protein